jgi:integral membrane protein
MFRALRLVGWIEGVSFLLLLGVAMPLKYAAGRPEYVKVLGWAHGILFFAFGALLAVVHSGANWPLKRSALVFAAALLPFGPFLIDRRMKAWETESRSPLRT